jgi:Bacteriophage baseplate protein W
VAAGIIGLNGIPVTSGDWSLMLDQNFGDGSGLGNVVQGIADVEQCLQIILTTARGSDLLRPDFAVDLIQYIDLPITQSLPHIVRDVSAAIAKWEKRVTLIAVTATLVQSGSQAGAQMLVAIEWQLKLGGVVQNTTVTIGRLPNA